MAARSRKRQPPANRKSTAVARRAKQQKKRPAAAVDKAAVQKYAEEIKRNDDRRPVTVHVVRALTRQFKSDFPIALNTGTRPTICRYLKEELGESLYARLCPSANAKDVDLPGPAFPAFPPRPTDNDGEFGGSDGEGFEEQQVGEEGLFERFPGNAGGLLEEGAQRFKVLEDGEVKSLAASLSRMCADKKPKTLSIAQGNGENGAYYSLNLSSDTAKPMPALLQSVEAAAKRWIEKHAGGGTMSLASSLSPSSLNLGSKAIVLQYGEDGRNYLHHDNSGTYQALLMLSVPGVDYNGGHFLLMPNNNNNDNDDNNDALQHPHHRRQAVNKIKEFPFQDAGELLVFCADKRKYLHGMSKVTAGTADVTQRFAVGLFQ